MKSNIFILLIIILTTYSGVGQTQDVESEMMKCLEKGFEDNGAIFKSTISNYEQDLVSNRIIPNTSGKSYLSFFRKIANDQKFENNWPKFLTDRFIDKGESVRANMDLVRNCQNKLGTNEKIDSINNIILDSFDQTNKIIANRILKNFDESDFEKDFYKLRILLMMDNFAPHVEEPNFTEIVPDTTDFLDIYLDKKNRIYFEGRIIDNDILNIELRKYYENQSSNNDLRFFLSKKSNYGVYSSLLNSISKSFIDSRNHFSIEKFGENYQELDSVQKIIVDDSFPKYVIE